MSRYHAIIFDLDGTLLNTLEDLADAVNFALIKNQQPSRTIEEIKTFVGNGVRNLLIRAIDQGEENPAFEQIFQDFKTYYGLHCNDKTRPYDGIIELLQELKQAGFLMAVVSNKLDSAVKELCELHFKGLIQVAIGDKENQERKPAPDMVNAALSVLGVDREQAIYIGDSEVDILTAQNVQMSCISVLWGFRSRRFLEEQGAMLFAKIPEDIKRFI